MMGKEPFNYDGWLSMLPFEQRLRWLRAIRVKTLQRTLRVPGHKEVAEPAADPNVGISEHTASVRDKQQGRLCSSTCRPLRPAAPAQTPRRMASYCAHGGGGGAHARFLMAHHASGST